MPNTPPQYHVDLSGRSHVVREVRGEERLSTPFRLVLRFRVEGEPIEPRAVVKERVSIRLERGALVRTIDGIVTDVSTEAAMRGATETVLVVEPRLALARYRTEMRIFRELTAPEIVTTVLGELGIETELRLASDYERRHYCVQFRETDFDFVSRLLEDEGIHYFFREGDVMVLGDNANGYEPLPGNRVIAFRAGVGMEQHTDAILAFGHKRSMVASKVSLRDFNPETPNLDMDVSADVDSPSGVEWYDFPGEYDEPGKGSRKAQLTAESFACAAGAFCGESQVGGFFPGASFILQNAPPGLSDGEHVVTAVSHEYQLDADGFSNRFEALDAAVTYRPPRTTPAPELLNPESGFVTGPPGADDIFTDAWGRVKVHFHWDRRQAPDDRCSWWIPVLQDNTGSSCAIPRRDWEVLVHFLEGDPDRPVVLGRLYHAADVFPHHPVVHKTRSALKSLSTPSRKGTNEIRLEDKKGAEHIWIHAQKDMNLAIANDRKETVIASEDREIGRDETITIGNNHKLEVGATMGHTVGFNQTWSVGGSRKREVRGDANVTVAGDRTMTVGGMHMRRLGTTDAARATKDMKETVGAVDLEISLKSNTTQGEMGGSLTVDGAIIELAMVDKNETTGKARAETVGGIFFTKASEEIGTRASKLRRTQVLGAMRVSSKKDMVLSAVKKLSVKAGSLAFTDKTSATFKVGSTTVVMTDGTLVITADTAIKLIMTADNKQGAKKSTQI